MRLTAAVLFSIFCHASFAIEQGQTLPNVTFTDLGRLHVDAEDKVDYQKFSTDELQGKRWLVQYISPRMNVGNLNRALNDKMNASNKGESCQTVSIINLDDAMWGTSSIALGKMKKELKENTHCIVVADDTSHGAKKWDIPKKSNVNWVLSAQGEILFYHEGKLSEQQMQRIITLTAP